MNCLLCELDGRPATPATAACLECGAAACADHVVICRHRLARVERLLGQVPVDPPGPRVRRRSWDTAWQTVRALAGSRAGAGLPSA